MLYEANLRYVKNDLWNSVGQVFDETGKLTSEQTEITGRSTKKTKMPRGCRQACVKRLVFSDSVLCVGTMGDDLVATWKSKIKWYLENRHFKDMNRIDGMPTEFEWQIFTGITALGLLEKIQKLMTDLYSVNWSTSKTESSSCQCSTTLCGMQKETKNNVNTIYRLLKSMLANSLAVIGLSLGLDQKRNSTEPTPTNPTDPGTKLQRI